MQQTRTSTLTDDVNLRTRALCRKFLIGSVTLFLLFALSFTLVPTLISEASAVNPVSAFASWSPVSLALDPDYGSSDTTSSRGNVVFGSITPTSRDTSSGSYGTQRVIKKTIGITSNGTYYTVFLSTSGSDNSLALDMENTDLSIPAIGNGSTTGVWSNPVAFSASGWGFSVPGTAIPASADSVGTSASATPPAFTNVVTGANLGKDLTKALDSSIYNQDIWSAVPSSSTPQQIWKATSTSANGFGTYTNSNNVEVTGDIVNDHFDIYYGIMVDTDVLSGTYENEIVYTALASATSLDDVSANLSRETYIIANGTEQTLHFDLSSNIANPTNILNKDSITIYLVPHATVASANYELTTAIKSNATNYTTCTIASNSDIELTDNGATLTCTSPDNTPADGTGLGEFDYWLHIDGYNYDYLSHYKKNEQDTATVAYIGLQSKLTDSNNELIITEMQEMTGSVCRNTNMWNNQVGDNARIMDYSGTTQLVADIMTTETDEETGEEVEAVDGAATSEASAAQGIGTFALIDNRDNKSYNVRHLADGNCWMIANIKLELTNFAFTQNLNRTNTDLNTENKNYWDPAESAYNYALEYAQEEDYQGDPVTQANYFAIASEYMLGVSQAQQFHYSWGYSWLGYYYDDNDVKTKSETLRDSKYSTMPRAFIGSDYGYYNWYAATAESGTYETTSSTTPNSAQDSICPYGWMLPDQQGTSKSYRNLYDVVYSLGSVGNAFKTSVVKRPIDLTMHGYYDASRARTYDIGNGGSMITPNASSTTQYRTINIYTKGTHGWYDANKITGVPVRCVARD